MNDNELNRAISEELDKLGIEHEFNASVHIFKNGKQVDYVNNWNELMPLVIEWSLKYTTFNRGEYFLCRMVSRDNIFSITEREGTLQRALAKCLLKILEANEVD